MVSSVKHFDNPKMTYKHLGFTRSLFMLCKWLKPGTGNEGKLVTILLELHLKVCATQFT